MIGSWRSGSSSHLPPAAPPNSVEDMDISDESAVVILDDEEEDEDPFPVPNSDEVVAVPIPAGRCPSLAIDSDPSGPQIFCWLRITVSN